MKILYDQHNKSTQDNFPPEGSAINKFGDFIILTRFSD